MRKNTQQANLTPNTPDVPARSSAGLCAVRCPNRFINITNLCTVGCQADAPPQT